MSAIDCKIALLATRGIILTTDVGLETPMLAPEIGQVHETNLLVALTSNFLTRETFRRPESYFRAPWCLRTAD